ncbi:family 16 glycosylhydrolase [Chitinophaga sp. SYP-B3965]|uniref:family 16 glycosylhydrolase n=1 Tax=Chitinophaga sp. SYP-B3965 TaxID=2663120 RepID=UPI0012999369|nr:family 16 glycosylhydrolase [Chitinophaga sp. SYP-B3965]MRG44714.1 family 16 glycosylhydrolase [Chitinophaga sp. SYP-B3965]
MKLQSLFLPATTMLVTLLLTAGCKKDTHTSSTEQASIQLDNKQAILPGQALQLVWSDEFDGTSLNTAKWGYENGNLNVNNEQQYYQTANVSVSNGNLVITARKQSVGGKPYTSGRINTNGKFSQKYGRIEANIKLPAVQGLWPAFWMLGSNIGDPNVGWPKCGEIDIMEHVNTGNTVLGTIHWFNNAYTYYGGNTTTSPTNFHVYAVEWDPSSIRWFVDGVQFHTANILNNINGTDEFHKNFFLLLNVAVGGNLPGQTINDNALPASMLVDYVRVYNIVSTPNNAPISATISIRGNNNLFVSGENGVQAMLCNRPTAQGWEQFTVVDAGGGKVALRSINKYVSSENGVSAITCSRATIGDWEKFDWVSNADGTFSLRGNNSFYISSENGVQAMTCTRPTIGGWEKFSF